MTVSMQPSKGSASSSLPSLTNDQAQTEHTPRAGRLALRGRPRGRQARAPDQLVLPQPRRGAVRRVHPADGRDGFEELPEDLARGNRRRQAPLPLPALTREGGWHESFWVFLGGSRPTRPSS